MEIEQFKLLLDMMGTAGDGAFTLAVLFLAKGIVVGLLISGFLLIIAHMIIKIIKDLDRNERALKELRYLMLDESTGYIDSSDIKRMKGFVLENKE